MRRRIVLDCERLDDRLAPANLTITNLLNVDANLTPQTNPVYGQMLYERAFFSSTSMAGGESVIVRFTVNGVSLDSSPIVMSAGNGTWNWFQNGWFIGTAPVTVTVTLDPNNLIAETNETDNTMTITVTPMAPTLASKFLMPIGRTANSDWAIENYADVDPRTGFAADAQGGPYQYDGHNAIDAGPWTFAGTDAGFPIYAAADGTVNYTSDGTYDRVIYGGTDGGNWVQIDHGGGWETFYGHLAKESLTVRPGDFVKAGQVIGLMASSGFSAGPHVHYNPFFRGAAVEPLYAPSHYWLDPLPYAGTIAPFVFDAFIANREPEFYEVLEHNPRVNRFAPGDTSNLYFTILNYNIRTPSQNTVMAWKWYRPDGTLWNTWGTTYEAADNARMAWWYWYWPASAFTDTPGQWRCDFLQDNVVVASVPFTIAATGDPSLKITHVGYVPDADLVINGRTTPISIGTAPAGGTPPTRAFTIHNQGTGTLTLSNYQLPPGFSIVGTAPTSVAANSSATLTVRLDTAVVGAKFGRISFTTNDPDVPEMRFNLEGTVTGAPTPGTPVITITDKALGYNFKSLPRVFAPTATMTDSDSPNFNTGSLLVEVASGGDSGDRLGVRHQGTGAGQIGFNPGPSTVTFGGTVIGTLSGGIGATPLTITLNSAATPSAVQALIRNLTYAHAGTVPSYERRYIRLTLTDNTGKVSNLAIAHVSPSGVERAPTIAALAPATTATGMAFTRSGSFSDPYGNAWNATVDYLDGSGPQLLTLNPDKTFTLTRTYLAPGTYNVLVTITSDTGGLRTATVPVTVVVPPTVSSDSVNNGNAQRSRITSITVNFTTPTNAALFQEPGSITLTRTAGGPAAVVQVGAIGPNGRITATPATGLVTSITLTFDNANGSPISAGVESGSLADGRWRLAIPSANYLSTLNDPNLRRLFGDGNADGTVDGTDFATFGTAFGQSVSGSPFDFDNNGTVDGGDFAAFGARFGLTV